MFQWNHDGIKECHMSILLEILGEVSGDEGFDRCDGTR